MWRKLRHHVRRTANNGRHRQFHSCELRRDVCAPGAGSLAAPENNETHCLDIAYSVYCGWWVPSRHACLIWRQCWNVSKSLLLAFEELIPFKMLGQGNWWDTCLLMLTLYNNFEYCVICKLYKIRIFQKVLFIETLNVKYLHHAQFGIALTCFQHILPLELNCWVSVRHWNNAASTVISYKISVYQLSVLSTSTVNNWEHLLPISMGHFACVIVYRPRNSKKSPCTDRKTNSSSSAWSSSGLHACLSLRLYGTSISILS